MKKNKIKAFCSYALALTVIASLVAPTVVANADTENNLGITLVRPAKLLKTSAGVVNFGGGSASITIKGNDGQTLLDKKFNVYKLFNAENSVNLESINYTLNPDYEEALKEVVGARLNKAKDQVTEYEIIDYIQSLNNNKVEGANTPQTLEGRYSDFRYFIEELRNKIEDLKITADVVEVTDTKDDNSISLEGLDWGYYVIDEVTSVEGSHSAASLCMVNTANPTADIKVKSDYPVVIKKIQEDDNRDGIGNEGWNDIGDFETGQTVPYKFESNISNMNGYDTYYYAWRDRMDKALTFKKETVAIDIIGNLNGQEKTYTLEDDEFVVNEYTNEGDTFKVEIDDIKAIVDREFNNMNANKENVYGQKVVLRYDATLNDNAAKDTGRPGFENEVKLVFSNDPDGNGRGKRGETPWDTVVCFTYKINGIKTSDHGTTLEGAKFRLYSDEALTNEVFVKKVEEGYIVINRDSVGGTDHIGGEAPEEAVEIESDENGVFTIFGLDGGTYYAAETSAPQGFRRLLDPIKLVVTPTFTTERNDYIKGDGATDKTLKELKATAEVKEFWAGLFNTTDSDLETNVEEGSANITVINKVGSKLPVTGSVATLRLLTTGASMVVVALKLRKKNS
ncbi:isopeptide-forming domain-containing fimbrial protein [uncultured Clostridium sp.]|uniref:isopeptide-forming domain-containing fimbrial protein n=1 Tax=uncultured Clostridium sp. TaxID=59620 RepID=UPI00280A63AD|nr:SpaA isopeptide-forming pilin-related protein [uncultured Clostridium sp.]